MELWNKYKCIYISWWLTEEYVWDYEVIKNTKTYFKMKKNVWDLHWIDKKENDIAYVTIQYKMFTSRIKNWEEQFKCNRNWISDWDENNFIVYCNRQWIPFIFTKI